jgi:hypothetical protein
MRFEVATFNELQICVGPSQSPDTLMHDMDPGFVAGVLNFLKLLASARFDFFRPACGVLYLFGTAFAVGKDEFQLQERTNGFTNPLCEVRAVSLIYELSGK